MKAKKKTIVVTGASSGFGATFARALAQDGHQLFICARRADRLAQVAEGLPSISHMACDVSREEEVKAFYQRVRERTDCVDVVIHCAATLDPLGTFDEVDGKEWLAAISANLFGAYWVARYSISLMQPERRPRILLLSGGGAFDPLPQVTAYGLAKAAIVRMVETLAIELAPRNIAINALAPGFAPTEIHKTTLAAGRERAGMQYERTTKLLASWDSSMELPVNCVRFMISDVAAKLTGKTISARFDPWGEPEFNNRIDEIAASTLYTTRRVIPEDLDSELCKALARAGERKRSRHVGNRAADSAKSVVHQKQTV
jgi:3-oxoacyl-[acyl-carrier protein] reductase